MNRQFLKNKTTNVADFVQPIEQTIEQLRQKMIRLQHEIQSYSDRPTVLVGETKGNGVNRRLARELHDSVRSAVICCDDDAVSVKWISAKGNRSTTAFTVFNHVERVLNDAQSEMRALLLLSTAG